MKEYFKPRALPINVPYFLTLLGVKKLARHRATASQSHRAKPLPKFQESSETEGAHVANQSTSLLV